MRIRVLCPGCGRTHGVDPGRLGPTGSEFTCRDCGTGFRVDASGEVRSIGLGQEGPLQDAPRPVERIDPEPPLPGEVACPRCQHRFVPGSALAPPPAGLPPDDSVHLPTILVAEDTAYFRELVRETLGDRYRMLLVSSKQGAVDALRREKVNLLLLDLSLDDNEDGREVLKEMGEKTCPILIFTARDEEEMYGSCWDELQSLGADDMLIKGMNVGENLLTKVEHLLSERK